MTDTTSNCGGCFDGAETVAVAVVAVAVAILVAPDAAVLEEESRRWSARVGLHWRNLARRGEVEQAALRARRRRVDHESEEHTLYTNT